MAIFSIGTSGIFSVSCMNLKKKETAVILKCVDQLPQNLVQIIAISNFFVLPITSIVFYCSSIVHFCKTFDALS